MSPEITPLHFDHYEARDERRRESLLGLGNGVLFLRASAPEAVHEAVPDPGGANDPGDLESLAASRGGIASPHYPGTYFAGLYGPISMPINGEQVDEDFLINLPNPLPLTFRAAGETAWFTLEEASLDSYTQHLDIQRAIVKRQFVCRHPAGHHTLVEETRCVSMSSPNLVVLSTNVTALDWSGALEIRSGIDASLAGCNVSRHPTYEHVHTAQVVTGFDADTLTLGIRYERICTEVHVAARTRIDTPGLARRIVQNRRQIFSIGSYVLQPGQPMHIEKLIALHTSRENLVMHPRDAARQSVTQCGSAQQEFARHETAWSRLWHRMRLVAQSPPLQGALQFHAFQLLATHSPHSETLDVGFPARGWQEAYHGHIFWDNIFVTGFLGVRFPEQVRAMLLYRFRRLGAARAAARAAGLQGAMYPWRSATTGNEETPRYQFNPLTKCWRRDHTNLERHVGAAIVYNVWRYCATTGDSAFLFEYGAPMLLEIARFWASKAALNTATGRYEILGVIGPDEYHDAYPGAPAPGLDNNAYTNLMAVWCLRRALELVEMLPAARCAELLDALDLGHPELRHWRHLTAAIALCFDREGVLMQFQGFDRLLPFDGQAFAREHPQGRVDWMLSARGDDVNRYQVTKQADVLTLFHLLGDDELSRLINGLGYQFDESSRWRTLAYYEARMTHESSLSRAICAGAFAQSDPDKSWSYFCQSMANDLLPGHSAGSEEGLHLGSMGSTLDVLQRRYLGLQFEHGRIMFEPRVPRQLGPVQLNFLYRRQRFAVNVNERAILLRADASNDATVKICQSGIVKDLSPGASVESAR